MADDYDDIRDARLLRAANNIEQIYEDLRFEKIDYRTANAAGMLQQRTLNMATGDARLSVLRSRWRSDAQREREYQAARAAREARQQAKQTDKDDSGE